MKIGDLYKNNKLGSVGRVTAIEPTGVTLQFEDGSSAEFPLRWLERDFTKVVPQ